MSLISLILTWLRRLLGLLLFIGKRPHHVAFIMDGNRRFASNKSIEKIQGHTQGYGKMIEAIRWCLELGVGHISVYAFSVENFKRSPEEVSSLMVLAESKYKELAAENGLAEKESVEIRVIGDLSLAPPSVRSAAARMMKETSKIGAEKRRAVLNICFSYSWNEDLNQAREAISDAVAEGRLMPTDYCPRLLEGSFRTGSDCPPVDLLIRTSGETRLSDFMATKCRNAHLCFVKPYWPDFSYFDFIGCVWGYQKGEALELMVWWRRAGKLGVWSFVWRVTMALIGFLPMDLGTVHQSSRDSGDSETLEDEDHVLLESKDDLHTWDHGKTAEEVAEREARIDDFFKTRELERKAWTDEHAAE